MNRLEQIQATIEELQKKKLVGLGEELKLSQISISAALPTEIVGKPDEALALRTAQLASLHDLSEKSDNLGKGTGLVKSGFDEIKNGLELIPQSEVDEAIDAALGLSAQAGAKLYIDSQTGAIIEGRMAAQLKAGKQTEIISLLGEQSQPMPQTDLAKRMFGKSSKARVGETISLIGKINRSVKAQDLPAVVVNSGHTGYRLGSGYQVIGTELTDKDFELSTQPVKPASFSISEVTEMEGVSGVLSDYQVRHLTQELLAVGVLRVGDEVMEGDAQVRGKNKQIVSDIELTPSGVEAVRKIAHQFGAQSRIRTADVAAWLRGQESQPAVAGLPESKAGKRYWISEVAESAGVSKSVIKTLEEIGAFKQGVHFITNNGRTKAYTDEALQITKKVADKLATEGRTRISEKLIREALEIIEESSDDRPYGPNGPNGPKTFTVQHEQVILQRLQDCLPVIERKVGHPIRETFQTELAMRLGELTERLKGDEALVIDDEQKRNIRRQAAATVLELAEDARRFNHLRQNHPGIAIGLAFIKGAKNSGNEQMIREFTDAIVNPPVKVVDALTVARDGLVGRVLTVGPMGDK